VPRNIILPIKIDLPKLQTFHPQNVFFHGTKFNNIFQNLWRSISMSSLPGNYNLIMATHIEKHPHYLMVSAKAITNEKSPKSLFRDYHCVRC
jgi:hypothetical protein